jgi:hypothetical protein
MIYLILAIQLVVLAGLICTNVLKPGGRERDLW